MIFQLKASGSAEGNIQGSDPSIDTNEVTGDDKGTVELSGGEIDQGSDTNEVMGEDKGPLVQVIYPVSEQRLYRGGKGVALSLQVQHQNLNR